MWIKTQLSGVGLTLISAFVSTLGLPYWVHVCGFVVGLVLFLWPMLTIYWIAFLHAPRRLKVFLICCGVLATSIWGMSWRITPNVAALRTTESEAASPSSPQLLSRMDRYIFACDVPPPDAEMVSNFPQEMSRFKNNIQVWGDAIGITYDVTAIRGGVRIVAEATTAEAKRRTLGAPVTRATIDVRRAGPKEIVTAFVDLPEILRFLSFMSPISPSDTIIIRRRIEMLVGASEGGCRLL